MSGAPDDAAFTAELVAAERAMYAPFFGSLGVTFAMIFTGTLLCFVFQVILC